MPAVGVQDILTLPRLDVADRDARPRPVVSLTTAPRGFEGEGFPVRRAFAGVDLADLDPFIHLDQMGEVEYAPGEPKGTPWHPHRGFETVTYMIDGVFEHADSNGGGGVITNGDTQWMTAGAGILHIEKPPEWLVVQGGLFHGLQLWVNLPAAQKWVEPRYQDLSSDQVALLSSSDGGAVVGDGARDAAGVQPAIRPTSSSRGPSRMATAVAGERTSNLECRLAKPHGGSPSKQTPGHHGCDRPKNPSPIGYFPLNIQRWPSRSSAR